MTKKTEKYFIWSHEHRAWWGPNGSGYTKDIKAAGEYTREKAADITLDVIPAGTEVAVNTRYAEMDAEHLRIFSQHWERR